MPAIKLLKYFILWCLIISFKCIKAQKAPYLERLVTLNANKQTIAELFKTISAQTSVVFSYSQPFNDRQLLSIVCKNKPLRLVIAEILKSSNCFYKTKDKYIIITCDNKPSLPISKIKGYIYNAYDSLTIPQASIYIKQDKHSAVTNNFGFFELTFSNKFENVAISVAKENYCDTSITLYNKSNQEVTIYLYPKDKLKQTVITINQSSSIDSSAIQNDDTIEKKLSNASINENRFKIFKTNFKNISDTLFSNFSVSFLPFVSTNRLLSVNTINKYSLNILAGYSKGIDVIEIGGLLNIDNGNVKYVQIGGLGNCVFGEVTGVQIAGLTNINTKKTKGVQIAGIVNINSMNVKGLQIGGIANLNKQNTKGMQIAGIYNQTKSIKGVQLSGIVNTSDTINGFQISGIVNKAKYLKGAQLSLINIADTASGIPIGFFSYVKKGYHKFEISTDETKFGTLSFGTGVNKLHTIFLIGINYNKTQLVTYGYGIGSTYQLHKKWNFSFSVLSQNIQSTTGNDISFKNNISKLNVSTEYKIYPKLLIGFGPTLSVFNADTYKTVYALFYHDLAPYTFYNQTSGSINTKMWVGAKLYLKIM